MTQELGRLQHWPCPPQMGTAPESQHGWQSQGWDRAHNTPSHSERMNQDQSPSRQPEAGERLKTKLQGLKSMQQPEQEAGTHLMQLRWMGNTGLSTNEVLGHKQKVLGGRCRGVTAISVLGALIP